MANIDFSSHKNVHCISTSDTSILFGKFRRYFGLWRRGPNDRVTVQLWPNAPILGPSGQFTLHFRHYLAEQLAVDDDMAADAIGDALECVANELPPILRAVLLARPREQWDLAHLASCTPGFIEFLNAELSGAGCGYVGLCARMVDLSNMTLKARIEFGHAVMFSKRHDLLGSLVRRPLTAAEARLLQRLPARTPLREIRDVVDALTVRPARDFLLQQKPVTSAAIALAKAIASDKIDPPDARRLGAAATGSFSPDSLAGDIEQVALVRDIRGALKHSPFKLIASRRARRGLGPRMRNRVGSGATSEHGLFFLWRDRGYEQPFLVRAVEDDGDWFVSEAVTDNNVSLSVPGWRRLADDLKTWSPRITADWRRMIVYRYGEGILAT